MANQGLKSYVKTLKQEIGVVKGNINLNGDCANLHLTIPILSSVGLNPIKASLIFNYQDRGVDGLFGKGFKLNYYTKINEGTSELTMLNADGSSDVYQAPDYKNQETQLTIEKVYDVYPSYHYLINDKYGNVIYYNLNKEYPYYIEQKNGERLTFDFDSTTKTINNGHSDELRFTKSGNHITQISYYHNNTLVCYANLTYNNDYLIKITWIKGNTTQAEIEINYLIYTSVGYITVKDTISSYRVKYDFNYNKVMSFIGGYDDSFTDGHTVFISYSNKKTTTTDYLGNHTYTWFDSNNLLLYEMDSDGNVSETEYDKESKVLKSYSGVIQVLHCETNLFPNGIANFVSSGVNLQSVSVDSFFAPIIGQTAYRATSGSNGGTLHYDVNVSGIATDDIFLAIFGKQLTAYTSTSEIRVYLQLIKGNEIVGLYDYFKKETIDSYYDLLTLGIRAEKSYSKIRVVISFTGACSIDLGGLQVIRKPLNSFYEYDNNQNIKAVGNKGNSSEVEYGANNLPKRIISEDSSIYDYTYDNNDNLINVKSAYGVNLDNVYNNTYVTNLEKTTIANYDNSKILETERVYTNDGRFLYQDIDELGNITEYAYDDLGRITQIINALGTTYSSVYNADGTVNSLTVSNGNNSNSSSYTYDSKKRLSGVSLSNGSTYGFSYDNYDNLLSITLNNQVIFSYEYDTATKNITKQRNGANGDGYNYEYGTGLDSYLLKKTYYVNALGTSSLRYQYTYDDLKRISKIQDGNGTILNEYTYDINGRIINDNNADIEITKAYDNLGNISQKSYKKADGNTINQTFDSVSRSKGATPESLASINLRFFGDFKNDLVLRNGDDTISPIYHSINQITPNREGVIPYISIDNTHTLSYQLSMNQYYAPLDSGCVQFWFRPTNLPSQNTVYLLTIADSSNNYSIKVSFYGLKIRVVVHDLFNNDNQILESDYDVKVNDWNFFALSFGNFVNDQGLINVCEYYLNLNGHSQVFAQNPRIYISIGSNCFYNIGHIYLNSTPQNTFSADIACLTINGNIKSPLDEIKKNYRNTKDYFIDNQLVDNDAQTVDFSQTHLLTISSTNQSRFDIFPLQNGVTSLKGTKPTIFDLRKVSELDKDRTFNFNKITKNYAYVADGTDLAYYQAGYTGTIVMRVYTDSTESKQYIFEGKDGYNYKVGLYRRGSDKKLVFEIEGTSLETDIVLSNDEWHSVGLSYRFESREIATFIVPYTVFTLRVDNSTYSSENTIMHVFQNITFHIGRAINGTTINPYLGGIDYYPLHGQIEMLCISPNYQSDSVIQELIGELKGISRIHEYDELGMLKKIDLHKAGQSILSSTLTYKARSYNSPYISKIVAKESIRLQNILITERTYTTNALGQVTNISDVAFVGHNYAYDYRGFLVSDDNISITYDDNGNITSYGTKTFTYDSTMKDKLIKVGNKTISYASSNPCNPTSYDGKSYEYEGRRLTKFTTNNNVYYTYKYNDKGLRISKIASNGSSIKYLYDEDKLISQVSSNNSLDFLYDDTGQLYGFIYNNTTRYYYIRDILQNILGIINESGTTVVQYTYNAYGNIISITGSLSSSIGKLNPFRYKGYYYDSESGMYYCKSRYYVPEWCRWLNNDSALYTKTDSYHSNTFAYCNNNPVTNIDENGNFIVTSIIAMALIGMITGAVVGAAVGVITALEKGEDVFTGALIGAFGGAVAGFFGGLGAGIIAAGGSVLAGAGLAFIGGGVGGGGQEILSQQNTYGEVKDWGKVALNAAVSGAFNIITAVVPWSPNPAKSIFGYATANISTSMSVLMLGTVIDIITWYYKKQKESIENEK